MFGDLLDAFIPGGFYIAIGVAIGAAFSERLRPLAKEALKRGMVYAERMQEASAEAFEKASDLVAEARYEQEQEARTSTRSTSRNGSRSARSRSARSRARVRVAPTEE
jgi:Protein of unknown function (DUF5132)